MGINFPRSAAVGQVHNVAPGLSFVYTPTGKWKPAPLKTAMPKNYIVNPSMQASQEGNLNPNVNGNYPADMWCCYFVGWPTVDQNRIAAAQPLFWPYYISFFAPQRALAANEFVIWQQGIEGQRVADLQWGTVNAKSIVVRLTCNCSPAGNYALAIRNSAYTHAYLASFSPGPGENEYFFAIPGCTDGVWATDNTAGMYLSFCPAVGTTYQAPLVNAWNTGNYLGFTGMTNICASGGGTFNIGRVGLYLDPYQTGVAPPFVVPLWSDERRRCQRYWYRAYGWGGIIGNATQVVRCGMRHPVPMRTAPVGTIRGAARIYDGQMTAALTSLSNNLGNIYAGESDTVTAGSFTTGGRAGQIYYQGEDIYIAQDARL